MSNHYHAETVLIEGVDAQAFAHAQFSSPVDSLLIGRWQFSAWLDPQGRVRAFFHLIRLDVDRYLILLRGGDGATLSAALQRFIFRSKVSVSAQAARTLSSGPAMSLFAVQQANDAIAVGCGSHSLCVSTGSVTDESWRLPQLQAGWAWLTPASMDEFLPAALSLQRLCAVAVDKGCYPGQEIVARLHFRGGNKRHLHLATFSQQVNIDTPLYEDGREAGRVLDVLSTEHASEVLLVLRDDIVERLHAGIFDTFDNGLSMKLDASWPA